MHYKKKANRPLRIVIVDSGYDKNGKNAKEVCGLAIENQESKKIVCKNKMSDEIGHGTAIIDRIYEKTNQKMEVIMIKIFSSKYVADVNDLNYALQYIAQEMEIDFLLISLGVRIYSDKMERNIDQIVTKGTVIISAFDNMKCISYPAAFKKVIGIDVSDKYCNEGEYDIFFTKDQIVDICGADVTFRLDWLQNKKIVLKGSSFFATDILIKLINHKKKFFGKESAMKFLSKSAIKVFTKSYEIIVNEKRFLNSIKKAVVLPINKEIITMAAYEDMCPFNIIGYYDVKYKLTIGKKLCDIYPHTKNKKKIKDIDKIDWYGEFDTIICGHMNQIEKVLGKNIKKEILKKCIRYGKRMYSFDSFRVHEFHCRYGVNYLFPSNTMPSSLNYRRGKLVINNTPTVLIVGTSSKQGKFTIQLELYRYLKKRKVNIGAIGTEPSSALLGFSQYLSYGYNNNCTINSDEMPLVVNDMIKKFQEKNVELIMLGEQSGIVPNNTLNLSMYSLKQMGIMLGLSPDSFILCINDFDDLDYVKKSIAFVKSVTNAELLCIVESNLINCNGLIKKSDFHDLYVSYKILDINENNLGSKLGNIVLNYYANNSKE